MVSNRSTQKRGSVSRIKLIEAAYDLLGKEGYRAFSARQVAQRAGLKPQLVHYHFRSMEELVVAVFERSTARYFALHDQALAARNPMRALWELNRNLPEGKRMTEFVALGKVYPHLRAAMREAGEEFRRMQISAMERLYTERQLDRSLIGPAGLVMLMSSIARNFVIEDEAGVTLAHAELREVIARVLDRLDPLDHGETMPGDSGGLSCGNKDTLSAQSDSPG